MVVGMCPIHNHSTNVTATNLSFITTVLKEILKADFHSAENVARSTFTLAFFSNEFTDLYPMDDSSYRLNFDVG